MLVGVALFVPVTPTISGTLSIQIIQGFPNRFDLQLITVSYSRETLVRSYASSGITLPIRPTALGSYSVRVDVSYGGANLGSQTLDQIATGTYGFKIGFGLRQETANVPYLATITVSGTGLAPVSVTFSV